MSNCICFWPDGGRYSKHCTVIPHAKRAREMEREPLLGEGGSRMVCVGEITAENPAGRLEPPRYTRRMAKKRQYSRDFTPRTDRRVQLVIDRIPPTLYEAVRSKAKREGVSLRALVLGWLKEWVEK